MKKTIFILDIDNFAPEVKRLTLPFIHFYAKRIGAYVHTITERKFKDWPVTYEKLQIYEIAQQMGEGWFLYIDLDALIHPECPDFTLYLPKSYVAFHGADYSPTRFKVNNYVVRDNRFLAPGNWFTIASNLCLDLWRPLEVSPQEAIANIFPTVEEVSHGITAGHLVDDYALTQNIARFGLKFKSFSDINKEQEFSGFLWHEYTKTVAEKTAQFEKVINDEWKIKRIFDRIAH